MTLDMVYDIFQVIHFVTLSSILIYLYKIFFKYYFEQLQEELKKKKKKI